MIQFLLGAGLLGLQAYSSLKSAKNESTEAKYNAKIKTEQAGMIENKKALVGTQWDRDIGRAGGTFVSNVAYAGIEMTGSPMAAFLDMTTQMEMDKEIELYNLEVEKHGVLSEAEGYRKESKTAMQKGYINTFSNLLKGGFNYYGG